MTALRSPAARTAGSWLPKNEVPRAERPSKPAEESAPLEEVIVTGSRIARQDYTALTPIVTVGAAAIETRSDIGIESALQQLPPVSCLAKCEQPQPFLQSVSVAHGGPGRRDGGSARPWRKSHSGAHRWPPRSAGQCDACGRPQHHTGRGDSQCGSHHGWCGFNLWRGRHLGCRQFQAQTEFQGLEVDAQQGISQAGDDKQTDISALMGGNFADNKGNLMVILNYSKRGQSWSRDHAWFALAGMILVRQLAAWEHQVCSSM